MRFPQKSQIKPPKNTNKEKIFWLMAFIILNLPMATKAWHIPQPGHESPVNFLNIHRPGR